MKSSFLCMWCRTDCFAPYLRSCVPTGFDSLLSRIQILSKIRGFELNKHWHLSIQVIILVFYDSIFFNFFFFMFIPLVNTLGMTWIAEIWECGAVAENKSASQERQKVGRVENKAPPSAKLTCQRKPKQCVLNIHQCWRLMWDSCIKMSETTFLTFFVELCIHVIFKPWEIHKFTVITSVL